MNQTQLSKIINIFKKYVEENPKTASIRIATILRSAEFSCDEKTMDEIYKQIGKSIVDTTVRQRRDDTDEEKAETSMDITRSLNQTILTILSLLEQNPEPFIES